MKGPQKEHHWATLLAARALDTTCYIVAAGECGTRNIGLSRIVDPLGTTLAGASAAADLCRSLMADDLARVRERLPVCGTDDLRAQLLTFFKQPLRFVPRVKYPYCLSSIIRLTSGWFRLLLCARVE